MRRTAFVLVIVLALAGCSSSSRAAHKTRSTTTRASTSSPSTTPNATPTVTANLEMASRTIRAGSEVRVTLVIDNRTGHPIAQPACDSQYAWQAYLTNGRDASGPLPVATIGITCDGSKSVAVVTVGESRLSFTTHATYSGCAQGTEGDPPTPRCLKSRSGHATIVPPLPAGQYRIEVTESPYIGVPTPAPLSARIVP